MAKRKRLTPAQSGFLDAPQPVAARSGPLPAAPIAQVAGDASAVAALDELSAEMARARAEGRLILTLPLAAIEAGHLVRDRLVQDDEDMQALKASLRARGQQTPIDVVALPTPKGVRTHGLISGWRRLSALRDLAREDGGERFGEVKARLVTPESQQSAYVSMVEENEIRADLSHYERARIALRAWQEGVYPTLQLSLNGLFGAVPRAKRSKIKSFVPLVEQFDEVLRFPAAISEKLGLALSQAIRDPKVGADLKARLAGASSESAEAELALLQSALGPGKKKPAAKTSGASDVQIRLDAKAGRIELTGTGVDRALLAELKVWLKARG